VVVEEEELLEYVNELVPHELELELGQELDDVVLGQELEDVELGQELEDVELGQELEELELGQELEELEEQQLFVLDEELDEEVDELDEELERDAEQLTVSLLLLEESELKPVTEHKEQVAVELLELELGEHLDFLGIIYI